MSKSCIVKILCNYFCVVEGVDDNVIALMQKDVLPTLKPLLSSSNNVCQEKAAQLVAELAKVGELSLIHYILLAR